MNKIKKYVFDLFKIKYVKCHLCNKIYYFGKYSSNVFCCNEDFVAKKYKNYSNGSVIIYNFRLENNFYQISHFVYNNTFAVSKCVRIDLRHIDYNGFKYISSKDLYSGENLNIDEEIQRLNNLIIFE